MKNTSEQEIMAIHKAQTEYFRTGETLTIQFRRKMLAKLYELEDEASNKTAARELN